MSNTISHKKGHKWTSEDALAWVSDNCPNFKPNEPYPGRTGKPWKGECLGCKNIVAPRLANLLIGRGHCHKICRYKKAAESKAYSDKEARTLVKEKCPNFNPTEPYPGRALSPWKGECIVCGNTVSPRLAGLLSGHQGHCIICGRKKIAEALSYSDEEARKLIKEKCPSFKPTEPYPGKAIKPWKGECLVCNSIISPSLNNILNGRGYCKPCGHKKQAETQAYSDEEARNLVKDKRPNFNPTELYPGKVDKLWRGECLVCRNIVFPRLSSLLAGVGHCKYCAGKAPYSADRALKSALIKCPNFKPIEPYPGHTGKPWKGKCLTCGSIVSPRLRQLLRGIGHCNTCGIKKAAETQTYSDEKARKLIKEKCPNFNPIESYPGSKMPWKGECLVCGNVVFPQLTTLLNGGHCIYCVGQASIILYLIRGFHFDGAEYAKIGVASGISRLANHIKNSWSIHEITYLSNKECRKAETLIKRLIKNKVNDGEWSNVPIEMMPIGGYTETFPAQHINTISNIIQSHMKANNIIEEFPEDKIKIRIDEWVTKYRFCTES